MLVQKISVEAGSPADFTPADKNRDFCVTRETREKAQHLLGNVRHLSQHIKTPPVRAAAPACAREGATLVVADIAAASAEATAHMIDEMGTQAIAVVGDISKAEFAKHLVKQAVATFGGLDSAFNNAGIVDEGDYLWDEAAFRRTIDINLIGTRNWDIKPVEQTAIEQTLIALDAVKYFNGR